MAKRSLKIAIHKEETSDFVDEGSDAIFFISFSEKIQEISKKEKHRQGLQMKKV